MNHENPPDLGCTLPPVGWYCSREPGHEGPCAARPASAPPAPPDAATEDHADCVCGHTAEQHQRGPDGHLEQCTVAGCACADFEPAVGRPPGDATAGETVDLNTVNEVARLIGLDNRQRKAVAEWIDRHAADVRAVEPKAGLSLVAQIAADARKKREQAERIAGLEKALREQHQWHLNQTDHDDDIGESPAAAYSDSALCERTMTALTASPTSTTGAGDHHNSEGKD